MKKIKKGKCSFCKRLVPKSELKLAGIYVQTGKRDYACKKCL